MTLEERALNAAESVASFNGLNEEVKNLLHTQYVVAASEESVLHKGDEGTFGQAIGSLKFGQKVARKGWNGKGMFLWLKPMTMVKSEWCHDPKLKEIADNNGGEIVALGTICMKTANDEILTGWLASQTDMLSNDWILV
ncbi:MAG: DUF2829 domain-containing protein [Bacteroides sp.]|nr:DUF2829 domain-containing protein [Bacteroides sp.]